VQIRFADNKNCYIYELREILENQDFLLLYTFEKRPEKLYLSGPLCFGELVNGHFLDLVFLLSELVKTLIADTSSKIFPGLHKQVSFEPTARYRAIGIRLIDFAMLAPAFLWDRA